MEAMSEIRRLDDLGRVVISKNFREAIGLGDGSPVELTFDGEKMIIKKHDASEVFRKKFNDLVSEFGECRKDFSKEVEDDIEGHLRSIDVALFRTK